MAQWVLAVAGIAILSVIADVILPEGQTRKYIKTVIGVVVTLVLVQPVLNFVSSDLPNISVETAVVSPQGDYLEYLEGEKQQQIALAKRALWEAGITNFTVQAESGTLRICFDLPQEASREEVERILKNANLKYRTQILVNKSG